MPRTLPSRPSSRCTSRNRCRRERLRERETSRQLRPFRQISMTSTAAPGERSSTRRGIYSTMRERLSGWSRQIKRDVHALYLAAGDPRVPWYAKAAAVALAAYALSPIDLIPDFIPVLGY